MPKKYSRRYPAFEQRFWSKVTKAADCWLWTASANTRGYGQIQVGDGKPRRAHRLAFEMRFGPIPAGRQVCHTCDTRLCVRNDDAGLYELNGLLLPRYGHLYLGSPELNSADMVLKQRQSRGPEHKRRTTSGLPAGDAYWTLARLKLRDSGMWGLNR